MTSNKIRNVAIIAHVDHGKTTMVDALLRQSGIFRDNQQVQSQVMDSNALERERGITILAKNTAVTYGDYRINIVDTPGHADFGGEVERVLKMVDGVLLVVDAYDGPMPQTRFVLRKALDMGLTPIVVVNKIDRPDARPLEVADMVLELFLELGADDSQIDFPVLYASGRDGVAFEVLPETLDADCLSQGSIRPIFEAIIQTVPAPPSDNEGAFQMLISNIDFDPYIGRIAIGRVERGKLQQGAAVSLIHASDASVERGKVQQVLRFSGLGRQAVEEAEAGEIICLAGLEHINIGDSVCDPNCLEPLAFVTIDEPTIAMSFSVNNSPFAGREGKFVTSRHLRDRLFQEIHQNVAMRVEETDSTERFVVKGRGELQISILIETMRREGYEFQVSRPSVITRERDGQKEEPEELLVIDVPELYAGVVIEKLGRRRAEMINMLPPHKGSVRLEFKIPSRGLIGYRNEFLTDTHGNGLMNSVISGFVPWRGEVPGRNHGVLVAHEQGTAIAYGLHNAQERGQLFIGAGTEVYEGMIVGTTMRVEDISVNVCKRKQASNMRASGSDEALRLIPPLDFSLEQCLEFIADDELIEVTPQSIRMRKAILDTSQRLKAMSRQK